MRPMCVLDSFLTPGARSLSEQGCQSQSHSFHLLNSPVGIYRLLAFLSSLPTVPPSFVLSLLLFIPPLPRKHRNPDLGIVSGRLQSPGTSQKEKTQTKQTSVSCKANYEENLKTSMNIENLGDQIPTNTGLIPKAESFIIQEFGL